ncbi:hypothetical protein NQ318_017112 [Aromia moschata]|uniref:GST C-terminal domain-containing protein n=1 Tax=Aromia moschata TaxID=1265417 RepID=A0AAV8Y4H8_9CUCU|nr:hypothetical protein NQ318_017112 [Aromia moschata]
MTLDFALTKMPIIFAGSAPNEESKKKLEESLELLDTFLKDQTWLAGPTMTIADFSIIATFSTIDAFGIFELTKYENLWQWYERAKSAMANFGYEEVNQVGATAFGNALKSKLK